MKPALDLHERRDEDMDIMCTLISRWFGGSGRRARPSTISWWEYLGSFGDDIFDEDPELVS